MPEIIHAENVDSFRFVQQTGKKCAFKGCRRAGNIKLFWRRGEDRPQRVDYICVDHVCILANEILSKYKFHNWEDE